MPDGHVVGRAGGAAGLVEVRGLEVVRVAQPRVLALATCPSGLPAFDQDRHRSRRARG